MKTEFIPADDGVRIAYRTDGAGDAPALLLCTMATAGMSIWDDVARALSDHWYVIRYDRRGDGDSDPGTEESHTFQNYATDALRVLDACRCATAIVCGMAFGARVALRLARDVPYRVAGLVLFDATGARPAPESERTAGQKEAARLRQLADIPPIAIKKEWFHRRDKSGATFIRHALKGQPDWLPGLNAISARTLVACGDCDPNLSGARRLAQEIPDAVFELMPMTGHASLLERPDLVLALLRAFVEKKPS